MDYARASRCRICHPLNIRCLIRRLVYQSRPLRRSCSHRHNDHNKTRLGLLPLRLSHRHQSEFPSLLRCPMGRGNSAAAPVALALDGFSRFRF